MATGQAAFVVGPSFSATQWSLQTTSASSSGRGAPALCHLSVRAPLASLTGSAVKGPQLLFQLSRDTTSTGSESDSDYYSGQGHAGSSSTGGSSEDTDSLASSELETFKRATCQICRKSIIPSEKKGLWGFWGNSSSSRRSSHRRQVPSFLVCDGCQRCYHETCCDAKGIATSEGRYGWFHSPDCEESWQQLQHQVKQGPQALDQDRQWQLLDCRLRPSRGAPASESFKQSLEGVLDLLLPSYGPGVADQLISGPRYALLLREGAKPVTAAMMDVYGQEMAVLDFVATDLEVRGKGHFRALLGAAEQMLGPGLGVRSLVAVMDPQDKDMSRVWEDKFGFKRLNQRQLRLISADLPPMDFYQGGLLMSKSLRKQVPGVLGRPEGRAAGGPHEGGAADAADQAQELVVKELEVPQGGGAAAK